jgi:hypothetical protein
MGEPVPNHRKMRLQFASTLNSSQPTILTKAHNPVTLRPILDGHRLVVYTSFDVRIFNVVTASLRLP